MRVNKKGCFGFRKKPSRAHTCRLFKNTETLLSRQTSNWAKHANSQHRPTFCSECWQCLGCIKKALTSFGFSYMHIEAYVVCVWKAIYICARVVLYTIIVICIYIYIYIYRRLEGELNQKMVSGRKCVRTRGVYV